MLASVVTPKKPLYCSFVTEYTPLIVCPCPSKVPANGFAEEPIVIHPFSGAAVPFIHAERTDASTGFTVISAANLIAFPSKLFVEESIANP